MARVQVINEVRSCDPVKTEQWALCFQWCLYVYDDGTSEHGYRFIWRRPKTGHLQGARGQARIPSLKMSKELMDRAVANGWGDYDSSKIQR